ncbi:MAG: cell division protein FtsB [Burkholderiales bacterium]|nr:cell division protein FtsB [Burkholderiales bacterium]
MRLIAIALAALLILIQFPLWLGKGGWLRTREMEKQLAIEQKKNADLKARNDKLESEVSDLKQGSGAVEERARYELGMIKDDEVFIQVVDSNSPQLESAVPRIIPRSPDPNAATSTTATPATEAMHANRVHALPSPAPAHKPAKPSKPGHH